MAKAESNIEFAARMGYSWAEWKALPQSMRDRMTLADAGIVMSEDPALTAWRDMEPGPAKVAEFRRLAGC
jgi:hypothetical protein